MNMNLIMMLLSMIMPMMKHPMTMGMILIMQTTCMVINMSTMFNSSWYSYIMFITMIGGLMIMFMYMSSVASNEKFKFNKMMTLMIMMMIVSMMLINYNYPLEENLTKMMEMKLSSNNLQEMKTTIKFFNMNKGMITIMLITILFISLVSVSNIAKTFEGPLKNTYV